MMNTGTKIAIARIPILGRVLLFLYRAKAGFERFRTPFSNFLTWLFTSRETTNFTYHLEEKNKKYLASLISFVTNEKFDVIMSYIMEIDTDDELRAHIAGAIERSDLAFMADKDVRLGRRIGWYAFARVLKPKIIIETGVDKGLGSCVLTAALKRNRAEGHEGRYYGTDINPRAGYLLSGVYAGYGEILYGDSVESLKKFDGVVDLFINDSDHSPDYEYGEYEALKEKLSEHAIILGDNSDCTDKLFEFSMRTSRQFVFFKEEPKDCWHTGGGIGVAFRALGDKPFVHTDKTRETI